MQHIQLETIPERELLPGLWVRFVHSDNMTLAYWRIEPGAALPDHHHPHEQVVNLIEGELALTVAGETRRLSPGAVVVIPGDVPHAAAAVSRCRVIDVFYPIRQDYR